MTDAGADARAAAGRGGEATADVLHGREVADPYRWLEDGDAAEVAAWVAAQNERTEAGARRPPDRRAWLARLVSLLELPDLDGRAPGR